MANLTNDTNNNLFVTTHTVANSGTYNYILDTENKFVDKKIKISFYTPPASITAGTSSVTSTVDNTSSTSATNIHGVLSSSTSRPSAATEYYIALNLTGSGNSAINTDGWITTNTTLPTSSNSTTAFYTIQKASGKVTNNAAVSTTVAITTGNVVTTSTNNGIYIKSTGSSTASGSITATIDTAGYIPTGTMATATISKTATTAATTYITGVTVPNTTFTVTAATNKQGTIKIAAYSTSSASSRDTVQTIVTSGVWNTNSIAPNTAVQGPYYGKTSIKAVSQSNLSVGNIKHGVNVQVKGGDSAIYNVTGTFTSASTVSTGQTASTSAQILSGYSAWVDGEEIKGNIANQGRLDKTITTQNGTITVTAGYYTGGTVTASLPTTSVTQNAWSKNASTNVISTTHANWNAGYISSAGNIPVSNALIAANGSYYLPEATNSGYIYITRGYIDNVKIDIGRLIPDFSDTAHAAANDKILKGFHAYDGAGNILTGTIESIAAKTHTPTTIDQTIEAGQYIAGVQTIKGDANLVAAKIQDGVTIFGVAGKFSNTSTITNSRTAVTAASLRSGYAAFINGKQINGTMPNASFTSNASSLTATTNNTAQSGTNPFSIYTTSNSHNISIVTATTTAVMGTNKVFITINSSGSVKCTSDPGGYAAKGVTASVTSLTRYISMDYYTGNYDTTENTGS